MEPLTQRAKLLGRVHGVVVQARKDTEGSSSRGKLTITKKKRSNYKRYKLVQDTATSRLPAGSTTSL